MKSTKFVGLVAGATVAFTSLFSGIGHAAGSATYALTSGSADINSTFSVTITENSSDPVNVVTANLTYDASKLQYVSVTPGASFGGDASTSGGNGSVSISRYVTPAGSTVTGANTVATVSFKALAGTGSTSIAMANTSKIASNGSDVWNHAAVGATWSLTTPTGGKGGDTPAAPTQPTGTTTVTNKPAAKPTPVATNNHSSNTPAVQGDSTTAQTPAANTQNANNNQSNNTKKNETKKADTEKTSSRGWFWLFAALAIIAGAILGRKAAVSRAEAAEKASASKADKAAKAKEAAVVAPVAKASETASNKKPAAKKTGKKPAKKGRK